MKIAVLGTGMVGRAHAEKLTFLGHEVTVGTQNVGKTLTNDKPDQMGNPSFVVWHRDHSGVKLATFVDSTSDAEIIFNALNGNASVEVLTSIKDNLIGKILIDISNPLDFSKGFPPTLSVSNTDSLGEQIQKALPDTKVIKTLNTMSAPVQVNPKALAEGDHSIFLSGNDENAKKKVKEILRSYGWSDIIDLGGIATARGPEMYLPLWLRAFGIVKTPMFNIKVVQNSPVAS
ncbi:MAG TPA: NAD(P)-binding domain-containing protein [Candidatus Saccharimonadales bacterium]|nr:NAD(P)-binding domain-containing protein [Candidatus Saccharimonadales bacterium]